jgi:hypothetical protein
MKSAVEMVSIRIKCAKFHDRRYKRLCNVSVNASTI